MAQSVSFAAHVDCQGPRERRNRRFCRDSTIRLSGAFLPLQSVFSRQVARGSSRRAEGLGTGSSQRESHWQQLIAVGTSSPRHGDKEAGNTNGEGTSEALKKLSKTFHANEWAFEVVVVNPGIDCKKAVQTKNTNTLLIACYEWLGSANTRLKVIGS